MSLLTDGFESLSARCTICHKAPKYKCPRCSAQTCSLQCVKTHKSRSMCSGVRDPGSYLNKKELNTPRGFDQDFNFISGLERSLEKSERILEGRGISVASATAKVGAVKGEVQIKRILDETEVTLNKMPSWMERHKRNQTSWEPRKRRINWTVEWILPGREKQYGQALDLDSISDSYAKHFDKSAMPSAQDPKDEETSEQTKQTEPASVDALHFLLHVPGASRGKRQTVIVLKADVPLRQALKGCQLFEFPTIEVVNEGSQDLDPELYAAYDDPLDLGSQERRVNKTVSRKRPVDETDDKKELRDTKAIKLNE